MPVTWDEVLSNMGVTDRETLEKATGVYKPKELIIGMPPDLGIASSPLITGKSLISLLKRGWKKIPKSSAQYELAKNQFNENLQAIWNPVSKKIEHIPTKDAQAILKNTGFSELDMLNMNPVKDFTWGTITPKTVRVGNQKLKENVVYGYQKALMGDRDFSIPGVQTMHPHSSMNAKNAGEVYEDILKYQKDNPQSYLSFGATPEGSRFFDISAKAHSSRKGPGSMIEKLKFLKGTKTDPNYIYEEMKRAVESKINVATEYKNMTPVDRVKIMNHFKNKASRDAFNENPYAVMKSVEDKLSKYYHHGHLDRITPSELSAIRLDIKTADRMPYMAGEKTAPPFGYESLLNIGNPENISVQALDVVRRSGQATKDLRKLRGVTDPNNPNLGAGFINWLEKQIPYFPNKAQEVLRKNFKLGLLAPLVPAISGSRGQKKGRDY